MFWGGAVLLLCVCVNSQDVTANTIPVIIFTHNRAAYLERALSRVISMVDQEPHGVARYPIFVSQDGSDPGVTRVVNKHRDRLHDFIQHQRGDHSRSFSKMSRHFVSSLSTIFETYNQAIVLEDDLELSVDFFGYFSAMLPVLHNDSQLLCVSSWNDNGRAELVSDTRALYRTDVFPGLGWMMTKLVFDSLKHGWPEQYWDEHLRREEGRQGRQCIRPEFSRVTNFGRNGTSGTTFYDAYVAPVVSVHERLDWTNNEDQIDIVRTESSFDAYLKTTLANATVVQLGQVDEYDNSNKTLRIYYDSKVFKKAAQKFNLVDSPRYGMERASYKGVINFRWRTNHVFLTKWDTPTQNLLRKQGVHLAHD